MAKSLKADIQFLLGFLLKIKPTNFKMKQILVIGLICMASVTKAQYKKPGINVKDTTIYTAVEQQPQFPGGNEAFMKFIAKNFKYPAGEIEAHGRIIASFIVLEDGNFTDFKIVKSVHPVFDKEAIRVLKNMPRWKPGMQLGKPVRCRVMMPIQFEVPEE
jgi:TonB family protein